MCLPEREHSNGAEHRDAVVRTVIFAFVSLAAWWGCNNLASADEGDDGAATAPASLADLPLFAAGAPAGPSAGERSAGEAATGEPSTGEPSTTGAEVVVDEPATAVPAAEPGQEPVLLPTVVVPLVEAASPALAPAGDAVVPLVDAVTTPAAPLVQAVVPVVDRLAGPVLAPVVTPVVAAVAPVLAQTATAVVAPVVGLAASVAVPVVRPVVALVAPLVEQVTTAVAAPLVALARPVLQPLAELGRPAPAVGLRPSTAAFPVDAEVGTALAAGAPPSGTPTVPGAPVRDVGHRARAIPAPPAVHQAAVLSGALTRVARPFDGPFPPQTPAARAAVMAPAASDTGQRDQRFVAVLAPIADGPAGRLSALPGTDAASPPARSGGRPPVTPD